MKTFPIGPQTVMSATCQPSLEPAVPLASVAPATCPSNQRDPGDASGTHTHSLTLGFFCVVYPMFAF